MKYRNQRPDLADQIKTLVQSANSVKTVPHGIKTVNPGEGLQLLSGDGAEIFWDWETANTYDTRISEGREAIEQARADLDKAEADLAAGLIRVDESRAILDAFGPRVDAAESTATKTAKDLTAVDSRLTSTAKDLSALQGTVGNVQSAVLESDRKAAAAQTAADQASSAAGSAASKAAAAQTTADQAKTAAGTADEAARAASGLAATKGEVIYQATAPTGTRAAAQNLWIRTTDNKPHTWNGSAWVAVTDKAATDAATAAATAQSAASTAQATADQAKADAAAAAQSATAAMTKAGQAQASADGKNTITRSVSPASQPGTAVGDTHFTMSTMGGGGVVTRQQRWDGSTWQDEALSHQVLASLDLGKATVGELDGGRIGARTIGVQQITVGLAGNLIVDPNFNDPMISAWRVAGRWRWDDSGAEKRFVAVSDGTITTMTLNGGKAKTPSLPVTSGTTYALILDMTGAAQIFLAIQYANGAVQTPGASIQTIPYSSDRRRVALTVIPDNYDHASANGSKPVGILVNVRQPANAPVGTETSVYSAKFAPRTGTVLIEDGAVTGDKVEAQTVAAKVGQFVKVQAANVEVTGDLAARVVNSMDTNTKNLVVTESAILQHTTLLGTTVADQLNVRKLIRGRDAILTGTVDVAQLNVTEAMSAEIVNAMSVAAKKLVVTEDAILNRATVVQSLVTPELIANRVDSRYVLSNEIVTGQLQVSGRLTTAPAGQPSLVMQPSQSSWNNKDLALWFTPDGNTPGFGNTDGWVAGIWMGSTPNTSTAQPLNLRGQSGAGLVVWGDSVIVRPVKGNRAYFESYGGQDFQIRSRSGEVNLSAGRNLNFQASTDLYGGSGLESEVRFHAGTGGFRITDTRGSNSWSYGRTTSQVANAHIDGNGVFYRVTSSRRYKKHISDSTIDPAGILQLRTRRWRDRKQSGIPEDMSWHYGMVAEEVAEIYPQFVPTIPDPGHVDPETGIPAPDAPQVPDSIEYDRLALFVATGGYQDLAPRVATLEEGRAQDAAIIASLAQRVAQLEGATK